MIIEILQRQLCWILKALDRAAVAIPIRLTKTGIWIMAMIMIMLNWKLKGYLIFTCIPPRLMWQEQDNMSHQRFKHCGCSVEDKFVSLNYAGESGIFGHKWHILDAGVSNELYWCVRAHKRRRIFGHTRHILEAGGRDREQIKNRSPLHQSVGLETRGGKLVDEEFGEGGGG